MVPRRAGPRKRYFYRVNPEAAVCVSGGEPRRNLSTQILRAASSSKPARFLKTVTSASSKALTVHIDAVWGFATDVQPCS